MRLFEAHVHVCFVIDGGNGEELPRGAGGESEAWTASEKGGKVSLPLNKQRGCKAHAGEDGERVARWGRAAVPLERM